jgi:transcription-repair coupling factor
VEAVDALRKSPYFSRRLSLLEKGEKIVFPGLVGSSGALVLAALAGIYKDQLIITSSTRSAEELKQEIALLSGVEPLIFPAGDAGARLKILHNWLSAKEQVVVAPHRAAAEKTVSKDRLKKKGLVLRVGEEIGFEKLISRLVNLDYKRFDIVGERGEFSVRGGMVDIFPTNQLQPLRMELVGERIASLRAFDPYSQRSTEKIKEGLVLPAAEEGEGSIIDFLPKGALVIVDGLIEVDFEVNVRLSPFLIEGEKPFFSRAKTYIDSLENIPPESMVFSRHGARIPRAVISGELREGFIFDGREILSDKELFGEEFIPQKKEKTVKEGVADELLSDLKPGDFVVHENYGIGIYHGIQKLDMEGTPLEYLLVEYAGGDKLFVPPLMIGLVEKYSGGREAHPRLSRLGSREWQRTCGRVKQSLRDMTEELLQLYAERGKIPGFAFPQDDLWQKELEATFPYEETPDQAGAIVSVKKDMESSRPMDRLVCGDVGYGKTEVALRAAAKAAAAGKQVAVLAPTTILVEQHYNNFKQRFQNFPLVVEMLSRFRSQKEQKRTMQLLSSGGVDMVIGTHRLLSKDIKFRDLGLLIIDEEQKFGVAHKEKLKRLKKSVDVLTLTATPIPRTLYFSLSGIREMSMISTPPVDRSPIRTYVLPFSEAVIREAVRTELDRGGQVYFVHNYVETIGGVAAKIKKLVPEARIAVGHGQMDEKALEKTMLDFLGRKFDILVCTAIIESGLDIPSVNTILIDRADRFGLSQLYQIRGRVGRSAVKAQAYLFYHPARSLTDQAVERLKAIQEFTALGSGYKLAMRDLEIRGAGNLLGAEQSGHIYEVGFDLYCELLDEAMKEIKGEKVLAPRTVEIDLKVEGAIPDDYVPDERQRIALYRRMNLIASDTAIKELREEMEDRFGRIPLQLQTLLRLLMLKVRSLELGVRSIKEEKGKMRIEWFSKKTKSIETGREDKINLALTNIAG